MAKFKKIYGLTERKKDVNKYFRSLATSLVSRAGYSGLGESYYPSTGGNAKRDLYKALGYKKELVFGDFYNRYKRQDLAKPIVNAPVEYSWRLLPTVVEQDSKNNQTIFEKKWEDLVSEKSIYKHLINADKKTGVGRFGLILIGVNDGRTLDIELGKASKLLYLKSYYEDCVDVESYEEDTSNERYGLPLIYKVSLVKENKQTIEQRIHYSRLIHITEGIIEDNIYGEPRLESVYNRLQDLDQLAGGSSEMFWRGAFPGFAFSAKDDAEFDENALDLLEDEIQDYMNELRRYMRLQGIDVKDLKPQIESPKDHFDLLVTLIAAGKQMPKRILLGSERGELASSQDERAWLQKMETRRMEYNEPVILRPLIDKLIQCQVLPEPKEKYTIEWDSLISIDPKDDAEVKKVKMEVVKTYLSTPGAQELIPESIFLRTYMDMSLEDILEIQQSLNDMQSFVTKDDEDDISDEDNIDEDNPDEE